MNIIQIIAIVEVVIILITVILTIIKEDYEKKKRCNLKVKGVVRDRWTEIHGRYGRRIEEPRWRTLTTTQTRYFRTYICVEYEYNGEKYSTVIGVSSYNKLILNDTVEVIINPMNPKESYGVSYSNEIVKQRMKLSDYVSKIIVLTAVIIVFIFIIFVVSVLAIDKFMK